MPFPLGGDFSRSVNNTFKIYKADRRICDEDNGTNICDAGYKLKFPGTCLNQPIGTFNSTDDTFQPTFPVCISDYVSSGFNDGVLVSSSALQGSNILANLSKTVDKDHIFAQISAQVTGVYNTYNAAIVKTGSGIIAKVAAQITTTFFEAAVSPVVTSFWRMAQFNPGALPHLPGVFSDLFVYDVVSYFNVYNRLVVHMLEMLVGRIKQENDISSFKNLVRTDYYTTISGSDDICIGDSVPPFITYHDPTISGAVLRPRDQIVDFSLSDAVAGVDLSSIQVDVDSTVSGTYNIVTNGVDQTGGKVNIIGDSSSFRFTYTPGFLWDFNEGVKVTISGSDLAPMVDGSPFFCGAATVNYFVGDIPFKILNQEDLPASLTPLGDVDPPYISSTLPASGTIGNDVFTSVIFTVVDNLTGVDQGSLFVTIDGVIIIEDGFPKTAETKVTGSPAELTVTYIPDVAFDYGSTTTVTVIVDDRNKPTPNNLNTSYSFSFISDSTLIIENFLPPVGTSKDLEILDIEVDVRDDTYGVDIDQTFLVVNGTIISGAGVHTPITSGTHMVYHPPNDFAFDAPIRVTVHGTNNNLVAPAVKEAFFTLFFGCRIVYYNEQPYNHIDNVDVFVRARNVELLHKDLSTGYFFTTYTQPKADLGADIFAINPVANLSASLNVLAPEHRYGQLVTVEFFVEDFNGNELGPFTFSYTIENKPV